MNRTPRDHETAEESLHPRTDSEGDEPAARAEGVRGGFNSFEKDSERSTEAKTRGWIRGSECHVRTSWFRKGHRKKSRLRLRLSNSRGEGLLSPPSTGTPPYRTPPTEKDIRNRT